MRKLFLCLILFASTAPRPASAVTVDRIAAVIDRQAITVSEVSQMAEMRFFPRAAKQTEDEYRRNILDQLIAQTLRFRDVERFGAQDIQKDSIEARLKDIQGRFASEADFNAALSRAELTLDELRGLIKRQLQVEAYIQERFAPLVFIPNEEIETSYRGTWSQQRRDRGLPVPPLAEVREEIRTLLRSDRLQQEVAQWTSQLRTRANVDVYAWR
jgi:hypothetical protein